MLRHAALLALLLASQLSHAGVVSRDLFEPGDGLLTFDDVSQQEWLDFSVMRDVPTTQLSRVLRESVDLEGFRLATLNDVWDLFAPGSGAKLGSPYLNPNARSTTNWIELLGLVGETESLSGQFGEIYVPVTRNRYAGGLTERASDLQSAVSVGVLLKDHRLEAGGFKRFVSSGLKSFTPEG